MGFLDDISPDPSHEIISLAGLNPQTLEIDKDIGVRRFQFWPESLQVSYGGGDWASQIGLGAPVEHHSWTSGGGAAVSFTAVIARELAPEQAKPGVLEIASAAMTGGAIGAAYAALAMLGEPMPSEDWDGDGGDPEYSWDVNLFITWLTNFRRPKFNAGIIEAGLPLGFLHIPNVLLDPTADATDRMFCVLDPFESTIQACYPDGTPRYAEVSLSFRQTMPRGHGAQFLVGREKLTPLEGAMGNKRILG